MRSGFFFLCVLAAFQAKAQDAVFANPNQSLLYLNPSFAGSNGLVRGQFQYTSQLPPNISLFRVLYGGADVFVRPIKAGIGLSYVNDNYGNGILKTHLASLSYAQHFSLAGGRLKIIPSLQVSMIWKKLDASRLTFGDPIDPRIGNQWTINEALPSTAKFNLDLSSGLLVNYKHFYLGTAVFHLNQPNVGLLGDVALPYRLLVHSSYNFKLGENSLLNVMARYNHQNGKHYFQANANALLFKYLMIGGGCAFASHLQKFINLNLGARTNFGNLGLAYNTRLPSDNLQVGYWEIHAGITIRDAEQRKAITDFERW
jgi:type IX secretion system PorP/SprF family membrane protein